MIINRSDVPSHLFDISELDFSSDLVDEPLTKNWFRLGAWTGGSHRDDRQVVDVVERQTLLVQTETFREIFDELQCIGNTLRDLGKSTAYTFGDGLQKAYSYSPFHRFELPFTSANLEPLVFFRSTDKSNELFINPDLWMFLSLEQRIPASGSWWDLGRGTEVLKRYTLQACSQQVVDIQTDYLLRYLKARQLSLLVGHYRHLNYFNPSEDAIGKFVVEDLTLGSPDRGVKVLLQNWGLTKDPLNSEHFLQRRLHLWFQIEPPSIDVDDPWHQEPAFDVYAFTLPTDSGLVAPAKWSSLRYQAEAKKFDGENGDSMDRIYFQQNVLIKYEGASGFEIGDDGSVHYKSDWGLDRSVRRIGNELLSCAIVDFAEGIPFEEWPHWKQYSVQPPGVELCRALSEEQTIGTLVNSMVAALGELSSAVAGWEEIFRFKSLEKLWAGSVDSLPCRQLKWVYPDNSNDDEFLKRCTLASTFLIDELKPKVLRQILQCIDQRLHLNNKGDSLGSIKLLERLSLVGAISEELQPENVAIPNLVRMAEGRQTCPESDLLVELTNLYANVRRESKPLALLYQLRNHAGLAHAKNSSTSTDLITELGLPPRNWHRKDYLNLLRMLCSSIRQISVRIETASIALFRMNESMKSKVR